LAEERLDERGLADAGGSGEERGGLTHFDRVTELEERPLLAFAGIIKARIGRVVEWPSGELPMRFVHGGDPK
jgi:hypothetical protein